MISPRQLELLVNSLLYSGGASLLALPLGLTSGFLLARYQLRGRKLWLGLLLLPLLIPPYLHAVAWRLLFLDLGVNTAKYLYTLPTAIIITALAYFPIVTVTTYFALQKMDYQLEEAALLIAPRRQILRKITLPLIAPAVFTAALVIFLLTLVGFGVTSFLHTNVYVYEIFTQFSAFFNFRAAYLLTIPLLVIAAVAVGLIIYLTRKPYFSLSGEGKDIRRKEMNKKTSVIALIYLAALVALALLVPLGVFIVETGSLANFWFALNSSTGSIFDSLWLAALATLLAVLLSAWLSHIGDWMSGIASLALVWLAVPSVTVGILLIKLLNRPPVDIFYTSFWIIVVGYLVRFLPFTHAIIGYFKRRVDPTLIEAARLTGASPGRILQKIQLPLWLPGILAGGLFFFVLSLTELATTILVYPSGYQTLPIRIFSLLHYGAPELVAALSLILVLLAVGFTTAGYGIYRYSKLK